MIWVGTSGYNYPEWKGSFYPANLPAGEDAAVLRRAVPDRRDQLHVLPDAEREDWSSAGPRQTPPGFRLTLKAPKRITHDRRLKDCASCCRRSCTTSRRRSATKLGALLFQLPPNLKKDLAVFDAFLADLPPGVCAAFEFRHASWLDDEVFARLRARNLALCIADSEKRSTPVEMTADYGYFRLRDEGYTPDDLARWAGTIRAQHEACTDVFVYFKHEEEGKGPEFAKVLMKRLDSQGSDLQPESNCVPTSARKPSEVEPALGRSGQLEPELRRRGYRAPANPHDPRARPSSRLLAVAPADETAVPAVRRDVQVDVRVAREAGLRNGSGGTNGSSSAVMMSAGTPMRSATRMALRR